MKVMIGKHTKKRYIFQSESDLMEHLMSDNNVGYCIRCGHQHDAVEPDVANSLCRACDKPGLFGVEELLGRGLHHIDPLT